MNLTKNKNELRNFGLFVGILFPLLVGFFLPYIFGHQFKIWTLLVGLPLIIGGLISPKNLKPFYSLWIQIGNLLGFINSKIILTAIFILIVQPIALLMKMVGYDPLRRRRKGERAYRENRQDHRIDLTRIF